MSSLISGIYGSKGRTPINRQAGDSAGYVRPNPQKAQLPAPVLGRVWLRVPYSEREQAKRNGARWDATARCWYAITPARRSDLHRWWPKGKDQR